MSRPGAKIWKLRGVGGRITECSIHPDVEGGFILRVSQEGTEIVNTCRMGTMERARKKADQWRETLLKLGEFQDCPVEVVGQDG